MNPSIATAARRAERGTDEAMCTFLLKSRHGAGEPIQLDPHVGRNIEIGHELIFFCLEEISRFRMLTDQWKAFEISLLEASINLELEVGIVGGNYRYSISDVHIRISRSVTSFLSSYFANNEIFDKEFSVISNNIRRKEIHKVLKDIRKLHESNDWFLFARKLRNYGLHHDVPMHGFTRGSGIDTRNEEKSHKYFTISPRLEVSRLNNDGEIRHFIPKCCEGAKYIDLKFIVRECMSIAFERQDILWDKLEEIVGRLIKERRLFFEQHEQCFENPYFLFIEKQCPGSSEKIVNRIDDQIRHIERRIEEIPKKRGMRKNYYTARIITDDNTYPKSFSPI